MRARPGTGTGIGQRARDDRQLRQRLQIKVAQIVEPDGRGNPEEPDQNANSFACDQTFIGKNRRRDKDTKTEAAAAPEGNGES